MICVHIVVEHFAVILLLRLDMTKQLSGVFVPKFKHSGVVER